jgi:AcrR family transcriptional regulator
MSPQRADARTNRARILAAADEVFGRGGAAASTEDVARLAGVGIATVFRHFPSKRELLRAVVVARLDGLRDRARTLAADDATDPGAAFVAFFTEVVDGATHKLTVVEALADADADAGGGDDGDEGDDAEVARAGAELRAAFAALLARAQAAGAVRDDVAAPEAYALMIGASRAAAHVPMDGPTRSRMVGLALDGLRARPPT